MTSIYDADQSAREDPKKVDWNVLLPADRARRARTQALLDAGELASGDDFYHAAYVFQHGEEADDCLKAHVLATVAVARGKKAAVWIAAATLDRYLQRIGQPQIYGTQFQRPPGKTWTQEPIVGTCCRTQCAELLAFRHLPRKRINERTGSVDGLEGYLAYFRERRPPYR